MTPEIEKFKQIIQDSKSIVFFGGAGVSTASGIPDFRSKNGLYNTPNIGFEKYTPEYLLSHSCLMNEPEVFFEFYRQKLDTRGIEPCLTHHVLAQMEKAGKLSAVVTQNIDGLHQKAGSEKVYEIHGSTLRAYCSRCGKNVDYTYLFDCEEPIPRCTCGGMLRPDVTLYEEGLPDEAVNKAIYAIQHADCLIIAGTSLAVYPAASYIDFFRGKYLVVINKGRTERKVQADLVLDMDMNEVFAALEV